MEYLLEGLLEGHESPGMRTGYKLMMVSYTIFTAFSCAVSFADITNAEWKFSSLLTAVATLGLYFLALLLTKWYRLDGLDPKFKKVIVAFTVMVLLLDVAMTMEFSTALNTQPPAPCHCPTPAPTWAPFTPSPPNHTTTHPPMI
eukprot:PhF_6_TR35572/c0_g1_i1/m.51800